MRTRGKSILHTCSVLAGLFAVLAVGSSAAYDRAGHSNPAATAEDFGCRHSVPDADAIAEHIFDVSDTNQDDFLSLEEFAAGELERYGIAFEGYDADGNGFVSFDEYMDLFEAHHPPGEVI